MRARILERVVHDPLAGRDRDRLDAEPGVRSNLFLESALDLLDHLRGFRLSFLELEAGIYVFGVLAHDHQVDVLEP